MKKSKQIKNKKMAGQFLVGCILKHRMFGNFVAGAVPVRAGAECAPTFLDDFFGSVITSPHTTESTIDSALLFFFLPY